MEGGLIVDIDTLCLEWGCAPDLDQECCPPGCC